MTTTTTTTADVARAALEAAREYVYNATQRFYDGTNGDGIRREAGRRLAQIDEAIAALAASEAQPAEPVAWLRDQRGLYEGPATLEPLVLLGPLPPGGCRRASYSPLYAHPPTPAAQPAHAPAAPAEQAEQAPNLACKSVQARLAAQWGYVKGDTRVPEFYEDEEPK
jgi:hypothetical protein